MLNPIENKSGSRTSVGLGRLSKGKEGEERGVTSNPSFERNDLHRVLTVCCPLETFARRYILRDIYLLVGREWKVVFEAVRIRIDSYCGAGKKKKGREKIDI